MAEVIRQLEKSLGVKSTSIDRLLKSDNSWYKSEYTPPAKYKSFKARPNNIPKENIEPTHQNKVLQTDEVVNFKTDNRVSLGTLSPSINYLMSISKNSKNTRAKVEARQALEYLKNSSDGDYVSQEVFTKIEKAVEYLKSYFGG